MNIIEKSESIRAGLRKGFQDGSSKMAQRRCYGYDTGPDGELVINPDEAVVVRWIFERYFNGDSLGKIATGLEQKGIMSPTGKPKWNREALNKLLSNEKYTGRVLLQKTISTGISQIKNDGIPRGSTVAVSTYMVSAHGNHSDQKGFFLKGYREMLRRIEPERVICYNEPFPEMGGNIVFIDYELSSWKHQSENYSPSKYLAYILGEQPLPTSSKIHIKSGCVLRENKGMGSAQGGPWKPAKPADERFIGEPGTIKDTWIPTSKGGWRAITKIGPNGRAIEEWHFTDHGSPGAHSVPHSHSIGWPNGFPLPGPPINNPGSAPEVKQYGGTYKMECYPTSESIELNRFKTISDFKWCVDCGGEIEFEWKGKLFGICPKLRKAPDAPLQMMISQIYVDDADRAEKWCDNADEVLEYMIDGDRLRDIITKVNVTSRTI